MRTDRRDRYIAARPPSERGARRRSVIRDTETSWGPATKLLHWLVAVLVLGQIVSGWTAVLWRLSPRKLDLFVWHKSIGMLILTLMVVRVLWRLANPTPESPPGMPRWERRAARVVHWLLYGVVIAMPLSGWIINSAANVPLRVFWLFPLADLVAPDKGTERIAANVHLGLFVALAALILIHVGAALRHHFALRDNVLRRMMPLAGNSR